MTRRALIASVWVAVIGVAVSARQGVPAAPPLQTFRSGTSLVPVDVRVLDKRGQPVTDLTARDFSVLEDRIPQTLSQFASAALAPSTGSAAPVSSGPDSGTSTPQNRRV